MSPGRDVFDRVVLTRGSSRQPLTPDEFFALPLAVRVQAVLERRVAFYRGQHEVEPKQALAALRKLRERA